MPDTADPGNAVGSRLAAGDSVAPSPAKAKSKKPVLENLLSLGMALIVVFAIRSSLIEAFKIPSGSMIPTLFVGDHIFVNKLAYGLKVPFSDLFTKDAIHIVRRDPPRRGDVIVFKFPKDESIYYIKRVVGVPGDRIEMRDHVLYVNGKSQGQTPWEKAPSDAILDELGNEKFNRESVALFTENLDGIDHMLMIDKDNFFGENSGPFEIPAENLFVMGDNRDYSNDSRFWGFVPFRNVKGKALFIWLSLWINFSDLGTSTFKPTRIGTVIH